MTRRLSHAETQAFWRGIRLGCHCEGRIALKQSPQVSCEVGAKAPLSSQQQVVKLQKIDLKPQSAKHDLIPHTSQKSVVQN